MNIKLLIVDDHELVRIGMERLLANSSDIEVVGGASDGEEAVTLARKLRPDVVLMDINMPGVGGIEATRKLLKYDDKAKIIIVTAFEEEPFPSRLLQLGASGYITKGASVNELIHAIRTVANGIPYINPKIAQRLALQHLNTDVVEAPLSTLSDRELEVLMMITKGNMVAGVANKLHISPKTVNSYRYRLFDKLCVSNDVELTYIAIRHGLIKLDQIMEIEFNRNVKDTETEIAEQS